MSVLRKDFEGIYESVRGSFTPEQFGVFLNMFSCEVGENYLVAFHETYHHWQSVFTPYGHMKWACERTISAEVMNIWRSATNSTPSARIIPAASMLDNKASNQIDGVAQIYVQDLTRQMAYLSERVLKNPMLEKILPIGMDELCPMIELNGTEYRMNGIDILEGSAKYQEAVLAYIAENKPFDEVIDPQKLRPEYYSALFYFCSKVGAKRILEFPVVCELALSVNKPCMIDREGNWKEQYPAWRFIKIVDIISQYGSEEILTVENIEEYFISYINKTLKNCGYMAWDECWESIESYAKQAGQSIPNDMLKAIDFKKKYPCVLAFPLADLNLFRQMAGFHPYYYITTDSSNYIVDSEGLGQEVVFENHFQALSHQICGHMSPRCMDRGKVQCGYSYYGIKGCRYQIDGTCDGHINRDSELPKLVMDENQNIVSGCVFEILMNIMGFGVKDLVVTDIAKKIDPDVIREALHS